MLVWGHEFVLLFYEDLLEVSHDGSLEQPLLVLLVFHGHSQAEQAGGSQLLRDLI